MTAKNKIFNRLISLLLCAALLIAYIPGFGIAADAAETGNRVSDPSTMDSWKQFFLPETLSTENAGGVWTDKSVFTNADAFQGTGITMTDPDSFLVALSAIASNMTVTGMNNVPTDTMLVLDVSGSMNDNNSNVAKELVEAANTSIHTLLTANKLNRVGIVLYSNSDDYTGPSVVLLPLGRYTTGADNQYVTYTKTETTTGYGPNKETVTTETVTLNPATVIEGTTTRPSSTGKTVVGGTFIQNGLVTAKNQFVATGNSTTVEDPVLGTLKRKPVLVLMSDGAPTYGSANFQNPTSRDMGWGSSSNSGLGFVTQLTAAWIKNRIEEEYGNDCLFYTLGLGTGNDSVATSVLDPKNTSSGINSYWTRWNQTATDGSIKVQNGQYGLDDEYVIKIDEVLDRNYVDSYFDASQYTASGSLAEALKNAFAAIVDDIQLQSKYYPTLISDSEDLSGYISFVDKIGQYMDVTAIKGILIDNTLYSGADLASNFAAGANGGALGTVTNPTELGDNLVWAVQARLGLQTPEEARTLIGLAYQYGQLSYTSATEFSNYIGWYANAAGQFLGFWHEGITTMPDPSDPALTDETRPVYIMKSYGYLGAVNEEQGVSASDMMYATVQLREDILTGEQTVSFAVPAALIPIVTYKVTLNEALKLADLEAVGAQHPIRLVYEVALDDSINAFNVKDVVSDEYLAANTNPDGSVSFYTNQYELDNVSGYGTVNTYSYFNPSRQNDRYYYTSDTPIYSDTAGTPYTGTAQPSGQMYRAHVVYTKDAAGLAVRTGYHLISGDLLGSAQRHADGHWYIPSGNVRIQLDGYTINKSENTTGTLGQANVPFVDTRNHALGDTGWNFYVGATLGNNGKLTLQAETGIRLTKTMAAGVTSDETFTFRLENLTNPQDNGTYPVWKVPAEGTAEESTVTFQNGIATVGLKAGDVLHIGGMADGQQIRITEEAHAEYAVETVNGAAAQYVVVIINQGEMVAVDFVNNLRGKGHLSVAKEVEHDFGQDYTIPADKTFTITVTLSGVGTANATFEAQQSGSDITSITTDAGGSFTVTLRHNEQIQVYNLPEGTVATVVEQDPGLGFAPQYWEDTVQGDGQVTILEDTTTTVIVLNDYTPMQVYPVNVTVTGTKVLLGRDWEEDDSFTFQLQRQTGPNSWITLATANVLGTDADKTFNFGDALANEQYTAEGSYYYRVIEIEPEGDLKGITYDKTVHSFTVDVADADMDGKLEIANVRASRPDTTLVTKPTEDSWNVDMTFTNTYKATGSVTVTVDLNKTVINASGSRLATLNGFVFELVDAEGNVAYTSQPTTDRGFARLVMSYEAAGVYTYTLREVAPDPVPAGWTYSQAEIPVTVVVTDTGDGHFVAKIYQGTAEPADAGTSIAATFTNTYTPGPAELAIDFAKKLISGRPLVDGEFTFAVKDQSGNTLLTGTNDAQGNIIFNDTLKFNKVGIYFFNVVETGTDANGVTLDKNVYQITVTVTDVDGQLTAGYTLVSGVSDTITFQNRYQTASVGYVVAGNKVLTGRTLLNDEFTFILAEALDASGTVGENANLWEAKNAMDGTFRFPEITYTTPGTYYYVLSEQTAAEGTFGIYFDTTKYLITVEVIDDLKGALVVQTVTYSILGGEAAEQLTFTNEYVADSTQAAISGDKNLDGKVLAGGDFQFQLFSSNENWEQGTLLEQVSNDQLGDFSFKQISFDKAGTYYYLVSEVGGGQTIKGITYDDTVFRVRIDVTDDLRGQLHATVYIFDDNDLPQEEILFVNLYQITGNAQVTLEGLKILTGRDMADGEFTFQLFAADKDFAVTGDPMATTANAGDAFRFILNYEPDDVGKTYYYVVRETNGGQSINGVAYDGGEYHITVVVSDDGIGGIVTQATITRDGNSAGQLTFTNHYTTLDAKANITGTKELTGKDLTAGQFSFLLQEADSSWNPLSAKTPATAEVLADGTFQFAELIFTAPGTYYYLVSESGGGSTLNGITYDDTVYKVQITVTDDGKGQLHAEVALVNGEAIAFTNAYNITGTDSVTLSGDKTLTGRDMIDGEFTFQLFPADEAFTITGEALKEAANAAGKFTLKLDYTGADAGKTYYYVLKEKNAGQTIDGVTYSDTAYHITVQVADDGNGGITVTTAITLNGQNAAGILFANGYTAQPADLTLSGTKELTGKDLTAGQFTFLLQKADAQWNPDLTAEPVTAANGADGSFTFAELTFTEAGTYYYLVREDKGGSLIDGITYDDTVYRVTVTVTDDGKGQLHATWTAEGSEAIHFVNSYAILTGGSATIEGTKELTGKDMVDGQFTFQLFGADENFAASGEAIKEAANAAGLFSITLEYAPADAGKTFYYLLKEKNAGQTIDGITYSDAEYRITVKVSDNGTGGVTVTTTVALANGPVQDIAFVNSYTAAPAELELGGIKVLEGRDLLEGEFTFHLIPTDGQFVPVGDGKSAVNGADGTFTFGTVTFTEAGTYWFMAKEEPGALERVSYDTSIYHITVTVTDNGKGQLEASAAIAKLGTDGAQDAVIFRNTFTPKPADLIIPVEVIKTVQNIGAEQIGPEGFEFTLVNEETKETLTAISDENGLAAFSLTFTEEDIGKTFTYTLTETQGDVANVTYSQAVYTVTVAITLSEDNTLVATMTNNTQAVTELEGAFENTYNYDGPPKTGEDVFPGFVMGTMAFSGVCLLVVLILGKKRFAI